MSEIKDKIENLRKTLHKYNHKYYIENKSVVSDYQFDIMLKELEKLELENPQYQDSNSPTQRVGGNILESFKTIKHQKPLYSLQNVYSTEELKEFFERIKKSTGELPYFTMELKYDGVAVNLRYTDGGLNYALTRGDGKSGDDITQNIKTIKNIPLKLRKNDAPKDFEVRGEIIMTRKQFEKINVEREEKNLDLYANPRNLTSGTLKMLDSKVTAERNLIFKLYGAGYMSQNIEHSQNKLLARLQDYGFPKADWVVRSNDIEEIIANLKKIESQKDNYPYDTDGVVIKIDDFDIQSELGFTSKFPKWAIAYKFNSETAITKLLSISYQVGRTGAVTPVANLEPTLLAGTVVKRASLYNKDQIDRLGLKIGDNVEIEKGGEIIPKITRNLDYDNGKEFLHFITKCPFCEAALQRKPQEALHYCTNHKNCPPQLLGRIEHFVSKKALNVDGLAGAKLEILMQTGWIKDLGSVFSLLEKQRQDLIGITRNIEDEKGEIKKISFQQKTIDKLFESLENAKSEATFERVLYGLGIRYVGETVSKKIVEYVQNIDKLISLTKENLLQIPEVGEQIAESVYMFFEEEENIKLIEKLKSQGLPFEAIQNTDNTTDESHIFYSKNIVITGIFERIGRDELKDTLQKIGAKNQSSISSKTDFVLVGKNAGASKMKTIENLKIRVINEEELIKMLQN